MDEFKSINICIPIDTYNRVKELCPTKKWGQNKIQEFHSQIYTNGLEHPWFIDKENRRKVTALEIKYKTLKAQLSIARKQLGQEDEKDLPATTLASRRHV